MRNDTGVLSLEATANLGQHLLVKLDGARAIALCGASDRPIGSLLAAVKEGEMGAVKTLSAGGTITCIAAGPITVNAPVMPATGGKVDDAATGKAIGVALNAAAADGDPVEVLPLSIDNVSGG